MPDTDNDLLARLNALKPSSVNLSTNAPALDVEIKERATVEDKLADRLKGLRAGTSIAPPPLSSPSPRDNADRLISRTKDEVATDSDPIRDWQSQGNNDEPDLDALLAELGPDDQWKLNPNDPKDVKSLLKEAKDALPQDEDPGAEGERHTAEGKSSQYEVDAGCDDAENGDEKNEDQKDEADANDYVQRVLAELEFDRKHGITDNSHDDHGDEEADHNTSTLDLPSIPSTIPQPPQTQPNERPPSYEDSELATRFTNLGLNLPSTPAGPPSARVKSSINSALSQSKQKADLPVYTDEDIDSWCCICNDDGAVRCLGCDGDIYCDACWRESHGTRPGQERGHKAVQYNAKSGGGGAEGKRRVAAS